MKRGKKYVEAAKAVDRATLYDTAEAISLVKKAAVANTAPAAQPKNRFNNFEQRSYDYDQLEKMLLTTSAQPIPRT